MKFIGQYIQSFIARFRNDVYLEDVSTGTIASGGNLGLDSNNKIVKATLSSGGISHDGSTANGVLTFKDADEATVESNLTFDGNNLSIPNGNIELGHANDTTIARSASGTVTIEGKEVITKDKKLHVIHTGFQDNMGTSEHFIPFNSVFESAAITNLNVPIIMPVAGKLLKVHMKVSANHNGSSNEITFKLYDVDNDELWSTGNSNVLGTKVITGTDRTVLMEADFTDLTTTGASGTNVFSAGDLIGVTITNSASQSTSNYLITMVFELDFNSY